MEEVLQGMSNSTNPSEIAEKGRRIALVIGVNEAPMSFMPSLKHAVADAEAMAEVLQQFGNFELLPPLLDVKAESAAIKKALLKLVQESAEEDILLLYFSGHGIQMLVEREDQPGVDQVYLVTNDFCEKEVEEDPTLHLSMRWLRDNFFNKAKARQVLLILDCCYAGDYGRTGPDPKALDLLQQIVSYFDLPGTMRSVRPGKLRLALTATGHNLPSEEKDGHGVMTGPLLRALSGEVGTLLLAGEEGQITLTSLYEYLLAEMPPGQKPSLSGDSAAQNYILTWHPERAAMLRRKGAHRLVNERPTNYLPFPRNPLFQPRPGEFEQLETLLFGPGTDQQPARLGLVGVVGLGGVGKTQLAVELAYRCLDQQRFPAGMFWMPATGTSVFEWQHQFAELAFNSNYLPSDDDPSNSENEARRARHFCRYLATHKDTLLILDNVEDPDLVTSAMPALAGGELACTILYTSRISQAPSGVIAHPVELFSEETALRLLLETTRPSLLSDVRAGSQSTEAQAAREICRAAGYLPLTLAMLRGLLEQDQQASLEQLNEALKEPGVLDAEKKRSLVTWLSSLRHSG